MAMTTATVSKLRPGSAGEPESERFDQHLLHVTFESPHGGRRSAFGGGETVAGAVEAARAELPAERGWSVARWAPVYGE
jgi:hypothetical protein